MTGSASAAPGGDNGDYYVSLTDLGAPQLTTLTANVETGTHDGEKLRFYTSAAGTGISMASLVDSSDLAQSSLVAMVNNSPRAFADETSQPARVMFGSLVSGDTTVVVVDHVFDISPSPVGFTLSVVTTNL
jgi:hypothetical protein